MADPLEIPLADPLAGCGDPLQDERQRALETVAQSLRERLIDQLNWCILLTTDGEQSLHARHLEWVAKINKSTHDLLGQVQELLDEERIQERARTVPADGGKVPATSAEAEDGVAGPTCERRLQADSFAAPTASGRSDAKVLLVGGSSTQRDVLAGALRSHFHVLTAADGWEALQLMVERPDAIVSEVSLAGVDFPDMVGHARRMAGEVPVLALHQANEAAVAAALRGHGLSEFLEKPFRIAALIEKVKALTATRRPQSGKSVLVLCSDPHEGAALFHLLDARYRTLLAPSARAAGDAADENFDVLIVDTGAGGQWQDVVAAHRDANEAIRILALADGAESDALDPLQQLLVNSVVRRPYSCDDLLARVRGLLGIKENDGKILRSVLRRAVL